MSHKIIYAFLSCFFVLSFLHASETVKGAKKDFESFQQEMSAKLEMAEKELRDLKAKTKEKSQAAKDQTIKELEASRDKVKADLKNLKEDSHNKWKKVKGDISTSMDQLNSKIQKALKD